MWPSVEFVHCEATYRVRQIALVQGHELVGVVHQRSVGGAFAQACRDDPRLLAQLGEAGVPDAPEAAHVPKLHCTTGAQAQGAAAMTGPKRNCSCMPLWQMPENSHTVSKLQSLWTVTLEMQCTSLTCANIGATT